MVDHVQESAPAPWVPDAEGGPLDTGPSRHRLAERGPHTVRMGADERFVRLRRRYAVAAGILVTVFLGWYLCYLYLAAYERDFMAVQVVGAVNVALLFGIGQFATTIVFAWGFARYAERRIDPLADEIHAESDLSTARYGRVVQP